ncbi:MAG: proteasome accessory factor PafA2 family protein [Armatimonadetes bacterium]|nr:proteasome accessory factor PafA2 family protein [Armatimonadota bacterium]
MMQRIFGIETEFGCLVRDPVAGTSETVVEDVKNYVFCQQRMGVIDLHARDYTFEPARAGGFLLNGGRLYIDAVGSHEEYATAECSSIFEIAAHERAGLRLLQRALDDMGLAQGVSFHNNSVDHFGGHTFGCHENYLARLDEDFFKDAVSYLLPFLVTRQLFAGAGRVGGHRLNRTDFRNNVVRLGEHEVDYIWVHNFYGVEIDKTVDFQLSQRADHILKTVASKVRFNRAIINPKWDSYYNFSNLHRLHLLFGEANRSDYATALKVGTTCLVLDLVEEDLAPADVRLADPIQTLKSISRDPAWQWLARRADGQTIPAVDLQRRYLETAIRYLKGRDEETDWVLAEWEYVLDHLEKDPRSLKDRLDWVAKRCLMEMFIQAEGIDWQADVLHSLDLEYHNLNLQTSLYDGLEQAGQVIRVTTDEQVETALRVPPPGTRAYARGEIIRRLLDSRQRRYVIDWDSIYLDRDRYLELKNPFHNYRREVERFLKRM